jgi:hypothetical protein
MTKFIPQGFFPSVKSINHGHGQGCSSVVELLLACMRPGFEFPAPHKKEKSINMSISYREAEVRRKDRIFILLNPTPRKINP